MDNIMGSKKSRRRLVGLLALGLLCAQVPLAAEEAQVATPPAETVAGIKAYTGEVTDEMIAAYVRTEAKLNDLRRQIGARTQEILNSENLAPDIYVAIVQRSRQDEVFLQRLREKAAELALTEKKTNG